LPGRSYRGDDPDGYMTAPEVVGFLDAYRREIGAPVQANTTVLSVTTSSEGYFVTTDRGRISCRAVVVATGACSTPKIPLLAANLPSHLRQLAPIHYRRAGDVEDGRVLVVGASASGVQLADELARAGRDVTLAVGSHTRVPRTYRGMNIHWWMDAIGLLDTAYDEVDDITKARRTPSLQLVGSPDQRTLDLNSLTGVGVELVGRFAGVNDGHAQFSGSLATVCADADLKMGRLLDQIDEFAGDHNADRPHPTIVGTPRTTVELKCYSTVIWATGFKPNYPWLDKTLLDTKGGIIHDGGVMTRPGLYVLGLSFMRTRKSIFIDGVGGDARFLSSHLGEYLGHKSEPALARTA
jgi:putative flavoprotein involved in K+ transport